MTLEHFLWGLTAFLSVVLILRGEWPAVLTGYLLTGAYVGVNVWRARRKAK
jgi:hypothetical protein